MSTSKQQHRKYHIVYQTTNLVNGKIYIGCHSTDDLNDGYLGSGWLLQDAIRKYGKENFERKTLYEFSDYLEMFSKEKEIVNEDFIKRSDVYNIVIGGNGGPNKGPIGKKRMSNPVTKERIMVHESAVPKMIEIGYQTNRGWSSTTNRIWIHKDEKKKMISKSESESYLKQGWMLGLPKSPTSGKIWIYHEESDRYSMCESEDLPNKIIDGWIQKKWSPIKKNQSVWINDGARHRRVQKDKLPEYLDSGWSRGTLKSAWKRSR